MSDALLSSLNIPGVCEATRIAGPKAGAGHDLLLEIPHGATRSRDFDDLQAQLQSELPEGLADFFYVNTDAGAPELAEAVAREITTLLPQCSIIMLRCSIPRTFVDCNRVVQDGGGAESGAALRAVGLTPGIPPYVRHEADLALLHRIYHQYQEAANLAYAAVCGTGGAAMMVHSYAPRSVDVAVDDNIVRALRHAYQPEVYPTWPLRPEVDLITRTPDGREAVSEALVRRVVAAYAHDGIDCQQGATYPLHPATTAYAHALRYEGRALCLEVRRDLLADPFSPFAQMHISPAKATRLARPLARAWVTWRQAGSEGT